MFNDAFPEITIPSKGISSPSFTIIVSPIFTSCGSTCFVSPFSPFKFAYLGLMSIKSLIDFLDFDIAFASNTFPISNKSITINPSNFSPTKYAPIHDITINRFSSIIFPLICFIDFINVLYNNTP